MVGGKGAPRVRAEADTEVVDAQDLLQGDVSYMTQVPVEIIERNTRVRRLELLDVLDGCLDLVGRDEVLLIDPTAFRDPLEGLLVQVASGSPFADTSDLPHVGP